MDEMLAALIVARETRQGRHGKVTRLDGQYLVGHVGKEQRAICFYDGQVDGGVLRAMFTEADAAGLARPLSIWGQTCTRGETKSFKFTQLVEL